jgi:hypothetical protein
MQMVVGALAAHETLAPATAAAAAAAGFDFDAGLGTYEPRDIGSVRLYCWCPAVWLIRRPPL